MKVIHNYLSGSHKTKSHHYSKQKATLWWDSLYKSKLFLRTDSMLFFSFVIFLFVNILLSLSYNWFSNLIIIKFASVLLGSNIITFSNNFKILCCYVFIHLCSIYIFQVIYDIVNYNIKQANELASATWY